MSISQLYLFVHGWIFQLFNISFGVFKQQIIKDVQQLQVVFLYFDFYINKAIKHNIK